jgi:enoyl-CoA hydratase
MTIETIAQAEITTERRGRLGIVTLNRPKALNALNLAMIERLDAVLAGWAADEAVDAVLIRGNGGRAFCSGGDVRAVGTLPDASAREALGRAFFRAEYTLNHRINTFPKPFIALVGGIVMGGGMGLSVHGTYRIAAETTVMAMPETVLGLFPDVGATWYLRHCPGLIGHYLALTGARLGPGDALWAGLATHHMPAARFDAFTDGLVASIRFDSATIEALIADYATAPEPGVLAGRQAAIDTLFAGDGVEAVIAALDGSTDAGADWPAEALAVLRRSSPTSLRATWRRMRDGAGQTIETILRDDYRMAVRMVAGHDFTEGVRSILVDKDNAPHWQPARLDAVDDAAIDALLAPMARGADINGLVAGDLEL